MRGIFFRSQRRGENFPLKGVKLSCRKLLQKGMFENVQTIGEHFIHKSTNTYRIILLNFRTTSQNLVWGSGSVLMFNDTGSVP